MKRIEITFRKHVKEIEKLNAQLERAKRSYEKKLAIAEKYGVANWTPEDRNNWSDTVPTTDRGFFINKEDEKKNGAWWDMECAKTEVEDIEGRIKREEARLEKSETALNEYRAEVERLDDMKAKEELRKMEFEQEQKEWAKDGIALEDRYYGITPKGKKFYISGNNGFTERSMHCFQLIIDGETIFTSGEFWRAYAEIKKR